MKKLTFEQMTVIEGGKDWLAAACGLGVVTLEASFTIPLLFAFTAPLTVGACAASALKAAM